MQRMLIIVHSLYYDEVKRASTAVEWFCGLVRDEKHRFRIECELKGKLRKALVPNYDGGNKPLGMLEHRIQWHPISAELAVV